MLSLFEGDALETQIEIDRYIGLPIFFTIFKHFTIIGYRFCKKKKKKNFFFICHTQL